MLSITCPHCKSRLRVGDDLRGKPVSCIKCNGRFQIPANQQLLAPATEPPRPQPRWLPLAIAGGIIGLVAAVALVVAVIMVISRTVDTTNTPVPVVAPVLDERDQRIKALEAELAAANAKIAELQKPSAPSEPADRAAKQKKGARFVAAERAFLRAIEFHQRSDEIRVVQDEVNAALVPFVAGKGNAKKLGELFRSVNNTLIEQLAHVIEFQGLGAAQQAQESDRRMRAVIDWMRQAVDEIERQFLDPDSPPRELPPMPAL
jgi:predicted Zn finger-like uncharacterized protein